MRTETADPWNLAVYVQHGRYGLNKPNLPGVTPTRAPSQKRAARTDEALKTCVRLAWPM